VAILGSLLATSYSGQLGGTVDALPAGARAEASHSIVSTLENVRQVEATGTPEAARAASEVVEPARRAFVSAMHVTALGTAAAVLVAAVVVLVWLPGRRRTVGLVTE
jgi:hypothetical protein